MSDQTLLKTPSSRFNNTLKDSFDQNRADQSSLSQAQKHSNKGRIKVLAELRPALEGFAGIPQETRLLFSAFQDLDGIEATGLINHFKIWLSSSKAARKFHNDETAHKKINAISKHIASHKPSLSKKPLLNAIAAMRRNRRFVLLKFASMLGRRQEINSLDPQGFEDFIWSTLFSKTLPSSDFRKITTSQFATLQSPYADMHRVGMGFGTYLRHPKIASDKYDIFLSQTPFPGRLDTNTQLIVRYHDAIPIYLPHTIPDTRFHQRSHYTALLANQKHAQFACTSEAVREDLLHLFPQLENRATVIHDMVSENYFEECASRERISEIIRSRIEPTTEPKFLTLRDKTNFYKRMTDSQSLRYIAMVSTIEPRKNHSRLIGAWEILRARSNPNLKLVIIGRPGWGCDNVLEKMKSWQERGQLFNLSSVPAADLRVLYNGAEAVVCPSIAEGFDLSGVEAMLCGGIVAASDIPVHREVYGEACEYFDPYSATSAVATIERLIDPKRSPPRKESAEKGIKHGQRYKSRYIAPKWHDFFHQVAQNRKVHA